MSDAPETLYRLLPSHHRRRDAELGHPLRALLGVLEAELQRLRVDTETMYDDWFIETCEPWLVPYIGELLGVRGMRSDAGATVPLRAFVANQIAYRRRKGTVAMLEQLARDLTGHPAVAIEYFRACAVNTSVQHVRKDALYTVALGDAQALRRIGTPFEAHDRSPDVRRIASGRGRHNLPNVGLHVWPTRVFDVEHGTPARDALITEAYRFDPLGREVPLHGRPRTEASITSLARREHTPRRLLRIDLFHELRRFAAGEAPLDELDPVNPAFAIYTQAGGTITGPWPLEICELSDGLGGWPTHRPSVGTVAVDPERGRLLFEPSDVTAAGFEVLVDYGYGAPSDVGAGPFDRSEAFLARIAELQAPLSATATPGAGWLRRVSRDPELAGQPGVVATLSAAIADWNAHIASLTAELRRTAVGLLTIADSRTYAAGAAAIELPAGARLVVAAARAPTPVTDDADELADGVRPVVTGELHVHGTPEPGALAHQGWLVLDGLVLGDGVVIDAGELEKLVVSHCSLPGGIVVEPGVGGTNAGFELELVRSMCGPVASSSGAARWTFTDSIVHGEFLALDAAELELALVGCTVLGGTVARVLEASSTLFDGTVVVAQHQQGCLRFCYAPADSHTPRRYRCQPDLALEGVTDPAARELVLARVRPELRSRLPADPDYACFDEGAAIELRTGGEGGSEIGVLHHLQWPIRAGNLRTALRQYLRFGLDVGLFLER